MAPTFLVSPPPPGMTLSEPEVSPARLAFSLPQKGRCFPRGAGHSHLSAGVFQAFRRVSYFCVGGTDFLETGPHFSTEARRLPITQLMLQPLGHLRAPSRVFKIHELLSLQFRICHLGDEEEAPVLCQKESGDHKVRQCHPLDCGYPVRERTDFGGLSDVPIDWQVSDNISCPCFLCGSWSCCRGPWTCRPYSAVTGITTYKTPREGLRQAHVRTQRWEGTERLRSNAPP